MGFIQCLYCWVRADVFFGDEPKNLIKPSISGILYHKRIFKDSQQTVHVVKEWLWDVLEQWHYNRISELLYPTGNYMFKLTIETLDQGVKYVQSKQQTHRNDLIASFLFLYC